MKQDQELRVGYQLKVRFPTGKLRVCNVESLLDGAWVVLRPEHSNKNFILTKEHEILSISDRAGVLAAA